MQPCLHKVTVTPRRSKSCWGIKTVGLQQKPSVRRLTQSNGKKNDTPSPCGVSAGVSTP